MIKSFKHKGLEEFFLTGSLKGIQANWRITFEFDENTKDVYIVDYQDYH